MKVIPAILDNREDLLEKSVNVQYLTGNVLDISSNFVASLLLGFMSYLTLMEWSLPFFIGALYFLMRLQIPDTAGVTVEEEESVDRLASFIVI